MKQLRTRLGLTHRQAAERAGISHGSIQNLERRGLGGVSFETATRVAAAYGMTIANLQRINEGREPLPDYADKALQKLEVHPDWVAVPVYGSVAAGDANPQPKEGDVAYIPREHLSRRGAAIDSVVCYVVNGNCMLSPETMRADRSFAPGDYVAVDPTQTPEPGDTVVAWWDDREIMVLKRFGVEEGAIMLTPIAPGHPAITLPLDASTHIVGPVVWRGG